MAVDVGNTQTVLELFEGSSCGDRGGMGLELGQVSPVIVSSVVPGLTRSYRHLAEDVLRVPFYLVDAEMDTGLKYRYDDPAAVGADRIDNARAAGEHYGFPVIIAWTSARLPPSRPWTARAAT